VAFGRTIYGACLAYLILLVISADTKVQIPIYRPTKWMRAFLEWNFWLPIATFSYSMYVWHILVLEIFGPQFLKLSDLQQATDAKFPDPSKYIGWYLLYFTVCLLVTFLWSILSYVLMEKASIDSRRVFKNKYATK
jgi:peptidoglycan/LPS O-acetylase OafA/YrhL